MYVVVFPLLFCSPNKRWHIRLRLFNAAALVKGSWFRRQRRRAPPKWDFSLQSAVGILQITFTHLPACLYWCLKIVFFAFFPSWLSCLGQSVTLSSMMEDLGISLQCYKGMRRRSRPHSGARSACVFCQPKRSSKREGARRDSSTWATQIRNKEKHRQLWSEIDCWLKVFHDSDWFLTCFLIPPPPLSLHVSLDDLL